MKFFITQCMRDRTPEDIAHERELIINAIPKAFERKGIKDTIEIIDSYFNTEEKRKIPEDCKFPRVYLLGKSIQLLSTADVYLTPLEISNGGTYPGVYAEKRIAEMYGIETWFYLIEGERVVVYPDFND